MCGQSRSVCGGRQAVKTPTLYIDCVLMRLETLPFVTADVVTKKPRNTSGFYTWKKSHFPLLDDCLTFVLSFRDRLGFSHVSCVWFLIKFSYLNMTSATEVNCH